MAIDTDNLSIRQIAAAAAAFLIALFFAIRGEGGTAYMVSLYAIAIGFPTLVALVVINATVVFGKLKNERLFRIVKALEFAGFFIGFASVAVALSATLWGVSKNAAVLFIAGIIFWFLTGLFLMIYSSVTNNSGSKD
jgi:hypothetical protein